MLITHHGERCYGCPFFSFDTAEYGDVRLPCCGLDGMVPAGEPPLSIKITDPEKQPDTCPFRDPHGISVEVHCA
jgi:hypothetical protein